MTDRQLIEALADSCRMSERGEVTVPELANHLGAVLPGLRGWLWLKGFFTPALLYSRLYRLEASGVISSRWVGDTYPRRRMYRPSEAA